MKRVVIESPLNPKSKELSTARVELAENIAYARLCMRDSALRGEAPYASHLLLAQDGVLDDESPEERKLGIEIGLVWGDAAGELTAVYVDRGVSNGMRYGIERAQKVGRLISVRSLRPELGDTLPALTKRILDSGIVDLMLAKRK